jgi:hypothetical protein
VAVAVCGSVFSVANRLSQAFLTTIMSRSAGESVQGEILGVNPSVTAVAQAIPQLLPDISRRRLSHRPDLRRFTVHRSVGNYILALF